VNALAGFPHVGGVEADQRVLADFCAVNRFGFDFVDGALAARAFLREGGRREREEQECESSVERHDWKSCPVMVSEGTTHRLRYRLIA
jgi:hypothetical protein